MQAFELGKEEAVWPFFISPPGLYCCFSFERSKIYLEYINMLFGPKYLTNYNHLTWRWEICRKVVNLFFFRFRCFYHLHVVFASVFTFLIQCMLNCFCTKAPCVFPGSRWTTYKKPRNVYLFTERHPERKKLFEQVSGETHWLDSISLFTEPSTQQRNPTSYWLNSSSAYVNQVSTLTTIFIHIFLACASNHTWCSSYTVTSTNNSNKIMYES